MGTASRAAESRACSGVSAVRCPGTSARDIIVMADRMLAVDEGVTHIKTPGTPKRRSWLHETEEDDAPSDDDDDDDADDR